MGFAVFPLLAVSKPKKSGVDGFQVGDEGLIVTGLSICWEDKDAYFISLQQDVKDGKCESILTT